MNGPFKCWKCGGPVSLVGERLRCGDCGAVRSARAGIFELLPPGSARPRMDPYATPFGWLYDKGVNNRRLAPRMGRLLWGADIKRMYGVMDAAITCPAGALVVDVPVGGGTAFSGGAAGLRGRLVGFDLSLPMLQRAARRRAQLQLESRIVLARGDATRLPLLDAVADRVLCFNSLHVIPDKEAVLREFKRTLAPGGELIGTTLVADAPGVWRLAVEVSRLGLFFVPPHSAALARLARRCGFSRWSAERVGALLYFRAQ